MLLVLCGALSLFLACHQSSCSASAQIQLRFGKSRRDKHNSVQGGKKKDKTQTVQSEEVFWRNLFKQEVPWSTTMDVLFFFFYLWPLTVLQPKSHVAQKAFLSLTATHKKTQSA